MKGVLLAGGFGTRLYPMTRVVSKQLLPVYDKPMVYYPLSVLLLAGIREVAVVSSPSALPQYRSLLGDGGFCGLKLSYVEQAKPGGIAQGLLLCEEFIGGEPVALILGDNIFYGATFTQLLLAERESLSGATIFGYRVDDPERYGVAELDETGRVVGLAEKPAVPASNLAVTGLYFYDGTACARARTLRPSARGELEITDLNIDYMRSGSLRMVRFPRGFAWLDTGSPGSLLQASNFVQAIQIRQGLRIAVLEEIALDRGFITRGDLAERVGELPACEYRDYLAQLL